MDATERRNLTIDLIDEYRDIRQGIACYSVKATRMVDKLHEISTELSLQVSEDFDCRQGRVPSFDFEGLRDTVHKLQELHRQRRRLYGEICRLGYGAIINGEETQI